MNTGKAAPAGGETSWPRGHCLKKNKHKKENKSFELKWKANKTITRILSHLGYLLFLSTIFTHHALKVLSYRPLMQTNLKKVSFSINKASRAQHFPEAPIELDGRAKSGYSFQQGRREQYISHYVY